jgi:hypothetical protein
MGAHDEWEDYVEETRRAEAPQDLPVPESLQQLFSRHNGKPVVFSLNGTDQIVGLMTGVQPPQKHPCGRVEDGRFEITVTEGDKWKMRGLYYVREDQFNGEPPAGTIGMHGPF